MTRWALEDVQSAKIEVQEFVTSEVGERSVGPFQENVSNELRWREACAIQR